MRNRSASLVVPFLLALALYLFFTGVVLLGDSFKLLGSGVAAGLMRATSDPFAGLFIGMLVTSIVQSSSATTSMVVALVSSGTLDIISAVPIIMGANIGTTVTNTIVSLGHIARKEEFERANAAAIVHDLFNVLSVAVLLPIEHYSHVISTPAQRLASLFYGGAGVSFESPVKIFTKPAADGILSVVEGAKLGRGGAGVIGIILSSFFIFFALALLVKLLRSVFASKVECLLRKTFSANPYLVILLGAVATAIVQSSSLTTSFLVPLVGAGVITVENAFPFTLGANIGTTVTAIMAAMAGNVSGLAIAFVHLLFNVYGTVIFFPLKFMRSVPVVCAKALANLAVRHRKLVPIVLVAFFYAMPLCLILVLK